MALSVDEDGARRSSQDKLLASRGAQWPCGNEGRPWRRQLRLCVAGGRKRCEGGRGNGLGFVRGLAGDLSILQQLAPVGVAGVVHRADSHGIMRARPTCALATGGRKKTTAWWAGPGTVLCSRPKCTVSAFCFSFPFLFLFLLSCFLFI